ncbi:hypothetical protein COK29_29780, partial [Bacillus cereus]|uniref:hypothetical protein n=1 Tax=Bacillus cereus TaxID=1396 RepID=UPI000C00BFE0
NKYLIHQECIPAFQFMVSAQKVQDDETEPKGSAVKTGKSFFSAQNISTNVYWQAISTGQNYMNGESGAYNPNSRGNLYINAYTEVEADSLSENTKLRILDKDQHAIVLERY